MSQQQTAFKVFFQDEIRRVGFPSTSPTLADLHSLLKTIFAGRFHDELTIQYTDEDNDRITVSSEIEWTEALRSMHGQSPKKIYIVANKLGGFFKDGPAPQPRFFYEAGKGKDAEPNKKNKIPLPKRKCGGESVGQKNKDTKSLNKLKKSVPGCLQLLFEGGKILPHNIPEYLQCALRVNVVTEGAANQEEIVDLDVDIHRLLNALFRRSLKLLDEKNYAEARRVIHAYLKIDPNSPLALYNLACTEALDNKPKAACKKLVKSVKNGYSNLPHLLADSDLDSIRLMPEYLQVVDTLRRSQETGNSSGSDSKDEEEKKVEEAPVEENSQLEPAQAPESVSEVQEIEEKIEDLSVQEESSQQEEEKSVVIENSNLPAHQFESEMQLLDDMGFKDKERNLTLLTAEDGDLANVIALLFE